MEERGRVGGNKFSANHILAKVKEVDGFEWYLTCFYGWPEASQKEKSWKLLACLKMLIDGPWLCIGDFNTFLPRKSLVNVHQIMAKSKHFVRH